VTEAHQFNRRRMVGLVLVAIFSGGALYWLRWVQERRDRESVAAFVAAVRRSQEVRPCAIAIEEVAQVAQQAKALPTPACPGPSDVLVPAHSDLDRLEDKVTAGLEATRREPATRCYARGPADVG
jgi:hypothetical protein